MRRLLALAFAAISLATAASVALAQPTLTVASGAGVPHAQVILHLGWGRQADVALAWIGDARGADLAVVPATAAAARRAAGEDLKAVYVVSKEGSIYNVLVVSERTLTSRGQEVTEVLTLLERARRWMLDNPAEAARVLGDGATTASGQVRGAGAGREYHVARPGPALVQALKAAGAEPGVAASLVDDATLRAAVQRLDAAAPTPVVALR